MMIGKFYYFISGLSDNYGLQKWIMSISFVFLSEYKAGYNKNNLELKFVLQIEV